MAGTPGVAMETGTTPNLQMEKCVINKQEIEVPEALSDLRVFMTVFSEDTWKNVLNNSQRTHLQKFLPNFPKNDASEKQGTVKKLFEGDNFKFGNSLKQFHRRLKGGRYSPEISRYMDLCRRAKHREYKQHQITHYSNLLKEVLINRQRILEAANHTAPDGPIRYEHFQMSQITPEKTNLKSRVKRRCAKIMQDLNEECATEDTSSSSEEEGEEDFLTLTRNRKQLLKVLRPGSPDNTGSGVLGTFDPLPPPPPVPVNGAAGGPANAVKPPVVKRSRSPVEMTEYDLQQMLCNHKRRKESEPHHPELSVGALSLEDVISRVQAVKKVTKTNQRKRVRERLVKKAPAKARSKPVPESMSVDGQEATVEGTTEDVAGPDVTSVDDILNRSESEVSSLTQHNVLPIDPEDFPIHSHFFSLIRDLVYEDPEQRTTTSRLEDRVGQWQESTVAAQNTWFTDQPSWVEQVQSALKFLSGDVLGLSLENFVPYFDYKERAQHWKWIGLDRDSDEELSPLYTHWLLHKDELPLDTHADCASSPPPARIKTSYTVRPTTDEEKSTFRAQERVRFSRPHQAFTFSLHGYECVVGPVKGVYAKENAMNKAREHALLVSDRPPYVTILTLVRDAAARLPNGEGTRSDICELLKDSQFLAPGVTENQINTVVSGALDRLHYERDPCVKYDVTRKLWIYLHRSRTEHEFERIHLAQGAAVKAKKALQKPKLTKKGKDVMPVAMSPASAVAVTTIARQPSTLSTCSTDSFVNVESLSPHPPSQVQTPTAPSTPLPPPTPPPKLPNVPSSPKVMTPTQSPKTTPQPSPKIGSAQSPKVQGPASAPPASKLVAASLSQPQNIQGIATSNHALTMAMFQAQAVRHMTPGILTTQAGRVAIPAVQSNSASAQGINPPRPVTISLLQPQSQGKPASQLAAAQRLTAVPASGGKVIAGQVPGGKLVQALGPRLAIGQTVGNRVIAGQMVGGRFISHAQSPGGKLTMAQVQAQVQAQAQAKAAAAQATGTRTLLLQTSPGSTGQKLTALQSSQSSGIAQTGPVPEAAASRAIQLQIPQGSSTQTVAAVLAKAGIVPASKQVVTTAGQPQVVNLNNLWAQQQSALSGAMPVTVGKPETAIKQVKIQGTTMLTRPTTSTVTVVTQATAIANTDTSVVPSGTNDMPSVVRTSQPISIARGGKPATMVITKPGSSRVSTATTQTVAQIIQSGALSKSAVIGGKPIIISGKSGMVAGRQIQIGGKPVQLIGKAGQLGLMQANHPGLVSPVSVVSQAGVGVSAASSQTKTHTAPSMVSQLLQQQKQQNVFTLPQQDGHIKVAASQLQAQQVKVAGNQPQVVAVSGSGQTKLVTLSQGMTGLSPLQQFTSLKTVMAGSGVGKNLVLPGGSVIQGSQLLVQPGTQGVSSAKVITQQQLLAAGGNVRPTLISTGGGAKGLQNFQLVKTVISQPGGKPGQTTILLAQPSSQGVTMATSQVMASQGLRGVTGAATKGKSAPIYARIIAPPQGVRLAAIRPGQMLAGGQVAPLQGLSVVQAPAGIVDKTVTVTTQGASVVSGDSSVSTDRAT